LPRFRPLAASLFATSTNALNHCFVYFCSSFVFFTLSRVCARNEFPHFESFDCAGREGKTSPKHSERDPRNTPVCKSSDHVSGGAIHASHLTRISNLTKIRSSLPDELVLVVVRPIFAFRAYASHLYSYSRDPSFAEQLAEAFEMDIEHVRDAVLYAVPAAFNQWEGTN